MIRNNIYLLIIAGVTISLEMSVYSVTENSNAISMVCAGVIGGSLGRNVNVQFQTMDGTANGMWHTLLLNTCIFIL